MKLLIHSCVDHTNSVTTVRASLIPESADEVEDMAGDEVIAIFDTQAEADAYAVESRRRVGILLREGYDPGEAFMVMVEPEHIGACDSAAERDAFIDALAPSYTATYQVFVEVTVVDGVPQSLAFHKQVDNDFLTGVRLTAGGPFIESDGIVYVNEDSHIAEGAERDALNHAYDVDIKLPTEVIAL